VWVGFLQTLVVTLLPSFFTWASRTGTDPSCRLFLLGGLDLCALVIQMFKGSLWRPVVMFPNDKGVINLVQPQ